MWFEISTWCIICGLPRSTPIPMHVIQNIKLFDMNVRTCLLIRQVKKNRTSNNEWNHKKNKRENELVIKVTSFVRMFLFRFISRRTVCLSFFAIRQNVIQSTRAIFFILHNKKLITSIKMKYDARMSNKKRYFVCAFACFSDVNAKYEKEKSFFFSLLLCWTRRTWFFVIWP